jgi:hypothetical protein
VYCSPIPYNKLIRPEYSYSKITRDILCGVWKESKRTFADDANTNLVLHVSFEALDNSEQDIFESFEPPPQIAEYFDTESSDVAMNDQALADAAANAFGTEQAAQETSTNSRELPSFVEIAFSVGRGADDIGSAPNQKEKFPAQKDFEAMREYYDDCDVTTEDGKRQWQRDVLEEITSNSRAAAVKLDKLSKSITQAQKRAIEEGELYGQYAAMGDEARDEDRKV